MPRPLAVFLFFFVLAFIFGAIFIVNGNSDKYMHEPLHHSHHAVEDYN